MSDWKSVLKADPTEWLLEGDNLAVRFWTLKDILGKTEDNPEVEKQERRLPLPRRRKESSPK